MMTGLKSAEELCIVDLLSPGRVGCRRSADWQRGVAVTGPSSGLCRRLSLFPTSSSIIPDGEISPVRLEAKTFLHGACPSRAQFQAMVRIRCARPGLLHASSGWSATDSPDTAFRSGLPLQAAFAQGSFAPEALPSFLATTSPCADPAASRFHFVPRTYRKRPCRLHHPRLVSGTVPLWS